MAQAEIQIKENSWWNGFRQKR